MTTYVTDSEGKFIPATQRPDGTWRKARRVKDGYVPQEEVPLYESKGKQFANRKSDLPPGFCPFADDSKREREKQERTKGQRDEAAGNKKKPKQQAQPGVLVLATAAGTAATATATTNKKKGKSNKNDGNGVIAAPADTDATLAKDLLAALIISEDSGQEVAKKLKKLRKKLREIEVIEEKIKSGELKKPEKDQLDKVKRKREVLKDIQLLEDEANELGLVDEAGPFSVAK